MTLLAKLIPLFVITPFIELAILIQVGKWLGVWETISLCVITGVLGAILVQLEGLRIWAKLQTELMQGKMPTNQLIDGVLLMIGGLLLLTPGLITDFIGFTLLLPLTRPIYRHWLKNKFKDKIKPTGYRKSVEVEVIESLSTRTNTDDADSRGQNADITSKH